jgi:uncharacterized protein YbjT (DUF2867 family)
MPTYAVTGATGHLGRLVIQGLIDHGIAPSDIVAVVRNPAKAADLGDQGVEIRTGDYGRPETLTGVFDGVRRVLFISGSEPGNRVAEHGAVIDAAAAARVDRVVYTSILHADTSVSPLAGEHKATEKLLADSGLATTLLRNGWYTENYTSQIDQYLQTGEILGSAGEGRISAATRADYAAATVAALTAEADGNVVYELGGAAFTLSELASTITEVTGRTVVYRDVPPAELAQALQGYGLDEATAGFVAAIDTSIAQGALETDSTDLVELLRRRSTPLAEAVRAATR